MVKTKSDFMRFYHKLRKIAAAIDPDISLCFGFYGNIELMWSNGRAVQYLDLSSPSFPTYRIALRKVIKLLKISRDKRNMKIYLT